MPRVNPRPFVFLYYYFHLAAIGNGKEVLAEVKVGQRNKRRKGELDNEFIDVVDEVIFSVVHREATSHVPEGKAHECDVVTEQWSCFAVVLDVLDLCGVHEEACEYFQRIQNHDVDTIDPKGRFFLFFAHVKPLCRAHKTLGGHLLDSRNQMEFAFFVL